MQNWKLSDLTLLKILSALLILFECIFPVREVSAAQVYESSNLRLSGYGTLSYSVDDRDDVSPVRDIIQKPDNPFGTNSTWVLDSRLGIQADYRFSSKVEFVLQAVLKDSFEPDTEDFFEAAYIGLRPFNSVDVRLGRFGYDAFLMSDIRNTGYAYMWVRPPMEFYGWIPIFSVNGGDIVYNINQGDVYWRIKAQAGSNDATIPMANSGYDFDTDNILTFSVSRQSGPLKIKVGYSQFYSSNEVELFTSLREGLYAIAAATASSLPDISEEASDMAGDLYFKHNKITYLTLGATFDDGTWVAQAEIGRSTAEGDVMPNGDMGYVSIGRRFNDFTPYYVFSSIDPGSDLHEPAADWSLIGQSNVQSQAIYVINSTRMEQYTHSLGMRWDFHNQAALKLQWDNTHIRPFGYGLWRHSIETTEYNSTFNLYTLSLEFIF